ncbi:MAG: RNA-binding S1 domain-containing protein [Osedax symbiont Rs2]|nr:MAG: RNA-binding S1 domain-containing protein [Osedax symbiont Rs2]
MDIAQQIATELEINKHQVVATMQLLDQGDTVPFVARYRKEATGALDDIQLRQLAERLEYLRQLQQRRQSILKSIEQQGMLTAVLKIAIDSCQHKTALEDLYLPFKVKRNSKAQTAIDAGLEALADALVAAESINPEYIAEKFLNRKEKIFKTEDALQGAAQILIQRLGDDAQLLGLLRNWLNTNALLQVKAKRGKADQQSKFRDYFNYSQALNKVPAHRALAVFRGIKEGVLKLQILPPAHNQLYPQRLIEQQLDLGKRRSQDYWLRQLAQSAWKDKLQPQLQSDLSKALRERAEINSIDVFAKNLADLLMAAPAGQKVTLALDPGLRSGVKVALLGANGELQAQAVIYPHPPQKQWASALACLKELVEKHSVALISIGNGTASRETEQLVKELQNHTQITFTQVLVSEAGASVYSASELASYEFPDVDVSIRGAISIGRRLQDPLAELVKIEPRAIGVGQYQHDLNQKALGLKLAAVVEDCVNKVGANLNSASVQLLTQVAGINQSIAENIVNMRQQNGAFDNRQSLLKVPRLGEKTYQQCAAFLRINNPTQPLDNSAVHPESYPLVEKMAASVQASSAELIGNQSLLQQLDVERLSSQYGRYTVVDTIAELAKPGRDPRPEFSTANFADDVTSINDLNIDMQLEGVVTNVTNFGAFVDIGVHQDGLVHISQLANQFVKDPHSIVKTGQIVQVRVLEVDAQRKRIALSMKH